MDTVWVLIIFMTAKQPDLKGDLLAFKTQAACEHMVAALEDPTYQMAGAKPPAGYLCVKANVQSQ